MGTVLIPSILRWDVPDGDALDWLTGFVLSPTLPRMVTPNSVSFTYRGKLGVPLSTNHDIEHLHGAEDLIFADCGTRVTYKVAIEGYPVYSQQKYAKRQVRGQKVSISRAKAVQQVSDVMRGFIEAVSKYGENELQLDYHYRLRVGLSELVLLELRQLRRSLFQVILAVTQTAAIHM